MPILRTAPDKFKMTYNYMNPYNSNSDAEYEPGSIAKELDLVHPEGASPCPEIVFGAKIDPVIDPLFQEIEDFQEEVKSLFVPLIQKTARGF